MAPRAHLARAGAGAGAKYVAIQMYGEKVWVLSEFEYIQYTNSWPQDPGADDRYRCAHPEPGAQIF